MDVYEPGPGSQIDDLNPGITPSGLFWTAVIPPDSVQVGFDEDEDDDDQGQSGGGGGHTLDGAASVRVKNIAVQDFGNIGNALFGGGPPPVPATLSYEVRWSGVNERVQINNAAQGFRGDFVRNQAQMKWSAVVGDFKFVSGPLSTSSSVFAELGLERNGSFFTDD